MLGSGSGDNKDSGSDSAFSAAPGSEPLNQIRAIDQIPVSNQISVSGNDSINENPGSWDNPSSRDSQGGIVVARGTGDGLILRLDGRVDRGILLKTLLDYVESRKSFFSGQEVTLEWVEARPEEGVVAELSEELASRFQLLVKASRMFERSVKTSSNRSFASRGSVGTSGLSGAIETEALSAAPNSPSFSGSGSTLIPGSAMPRTRPTPVAPRINDKSTDSKSSINSPFNSMTNSNNSGSTSLFDGVTTFSSSSPHYSPSSGLSPSAGFSTSSTTADRRLSSEALLWDEPDTRIIRDTLRGGQKIDSEHSIVIMGDVNSGAEVVAGGDIFVLGRLRGVAHAGAYDESGGGRKILALQMQPTQLRIGSIISQGSDEGGRMPEIAKIEGNMIVVEPYGASSQAKRTGR